MESRGNSQPREEYRGETPSTAYQPNYGYAMPYTTAPYYYPLLRSRTNWIVVTIFWIFYVTVGVWIDLSLTLALWLCALILPFTLPLVALYYYSGEVASSDSWIASQNAATSLGAAGFITAIGIMLLIFSVFTFKPWLKFHRLMFREAGGLRI
jgi:hypothetical protein